MSDSPKDKRTSKALTPRQQLRNLLNGLLNEEGICPEKQFRSDERAWLKEMLKDLDGSRIDDAEANDFIAQVRGNLSEANWAKKTKKKPPSSGYVM
jgi:hypothetical protein